MWKEKSQLSYEHLRRDIAGSLAEVSDVFFSASFPRRATLSLGITWNEKKDVVKTQLLLLHASLIEPCDTCGTKWKRIGPTPTSNQLTSTSTRWLHSSWMKQNNLKCSNKWLPLAWYSAAGDSIAALLWRPSFLFYLHRKKKKSHFYNLSRPKKKHLCKLNFPFSFLFFFPRRRSGERRDGGCHLGTLTNDSVFLSIKATACNVASDLRGRWTPWHQSQHHVMVSLTPWVLIKSRQRGSADNALGISIHHRAA